MSAFHWLLRLRFVSHDETVQAWVRVWYGNANSSQIKPHSVGRTLACTHTMRFLWRLSYRTQLKEEF